MHYIYFTRRMFLRKKLWLRSAKDLISTSYSTSKFFYKIFSKVSGLPQRFSSICEFFGWLIFSLLFHNSSYSTPQRTMESAISPPSPRRFPPMMQSLKMTTTTSAPSDEFSSTSVDGSSPIYPLNVGTLTRNHHRHHNNNNNQHLRTRTISNGSSISDEGVSPVTSPTSTFGRTHYRRFKSSGSSTSSISSTSGESLK